MACRSHYYLAVPILSSVRVVRAVNTVLMCALVLYGASLVLACGISLGEVALYGIYLLLGVAAPGTLVLKAVRGTTGSWLSDIVLGTVVGISLGLLAWALFSLAGLRGMLWAWPLLTLLTLAGPVARRRIAQLPSRPWPLWASGLLALGTGLMMQFQATTFYQGQEPWPTGVQPYVDIPWHLGLIHEAERAFPLLTPQIISDGPLKYSWFVHAHLATASMSTGIEAEHVLRFLWPLPASALTLLVVASVGRLLSRRAWVGVLALWMFYPRTSVDLWPNAIIGSNLFSPNSPTQLFSYAMTVTFGWQAAEMLRGRGVRRPASWALLALLGLAVSGAKSSSMSLMFGGAAAAMLLALILRRRRLAALGVLLVSAVFEVVSLALVSGGNYGSKTYYFAIYQAQPMYAGVVNTRTLEGGITPSLFDTPELGPWLFVAATLGILLYAARQLAFIVPLVQRRLRRSLAAWYFAGCVAAAWLPFLMLGHGGFSQIYFIMGAAPFGVILFAWALGEAAGRDARMLRAVGVGLGLGVALCLLAKTLAPGDRPQGREAWVEATVAFLWQIGIVTAVVAVGGAIWLYWARRRPGRVVLFGLLAAPLLVSGHSFQPSVPPAPAEPVPAVRDEQAAGVWMRDVAPAEDIVATNAICRPTKTNSFVLNRSCDSRRWLVSGIGGHRVLLDGWRYTAKGAVGDYEDEELFEFNRVLFHEPTEETIERAKQLGVKWLFAARADDRLSPRLDEFGERAFVNDAVIVYRLR